MKQVSKQVLQFLILYSILLTIGILLIQAGIITLSLVKYSTLVTVMAAITLGALLLVRLGMKRNEKEQGVILLAGIGGKFIAYLILILIYWSVGKNLSREFIIVFFVLYLMLTIFLVGALFKILKTN